MSPARAVAAPRATAAPGGAATSWIGPDLVTGEGLVSVDVSFLVRDALRGCRTSPATGTPPSSAADPH